jgi:two-component sensor histidine kinase/ActR/RegA family two-component response regulator
MSENMASGGIPIPATRQAAGMLGTHALKVMIAEDDLILADMLEDVLVRGGYEVCGIANTVEGAVELGERHKPDLAVLDIRLAKGGLGTDIPARLNRPADMGVLFATGHGPMNLTKIDGDAVITKPYRTEDIVRSLKIVEDIVRTGDASPPYPKGLTVLIAPHEGGSANDPNTDQLNSAFSDLIKHLRFQQAELARFGTFTRSGANLDAILEEATRVCAACLSTPYCTIYRYRSASSDFVVQAATGMHRGWIGQVLAPVDDALPQGRCFLADGPLIENDFGKNSSFILPIPYAEHGITSTICVPSGTSSGVLGVDNTKRSNFSDVDVTFLVGFANILAAAQVAENRAEALKLATERLESLIADRARLISAHELAIAGKDRLIETNNVLTRELQHRARNNLQLVYTMLSQVDNNSSNSAEKDSINAIARRVLTLVEIYEHLLGANLGRTIHFGGYLESLCSKMSVLNEGVRPRVVLTCHSLPITLELDTATSLGLAVAELISNSYEHAFPSRNGSVVVSMSEATPLGNATITVVDDGVGFSDDASDNKRRGVGLVKRLLEQIGGSATFRSDHGTEWTLTFPFPTISTTAPASAD